MPDLPLTEVSIHCPEDLCIKEDEEDTGDSQAWEEPLNWSTETRNLAAPWGVEQGLRRRRCSKTVAKGPCHSPCQEGETAAEGLVK